MGGYRGRCGIDGGAGAVGLKRTSEDGDIGKYKKSFWFLSGIVNRIFLTVRHGCRRGVGDASMRHPCRRDA